jgi:hypothetical protein
MEADERAFNTLSADLDTKVTIGGGGPSSGPVVVTQPAFSPPPPVPLPPPPQTTTCHRVGMNVVCNTF